MRCAEFLAPTATWDRPRVGERLRGLQFAQPGTELGEPLGAVAGPDLPRIPGPSILHLPHSTTDPAASYAATTPVFVAHLFQEFVFHAELAVAADGDFGAVTEAAAALRKIIAAGL